MSIRGIDSDNYDGAVPASHFKMLHDQYDVRFNVIGLEAQMPFVQAQLSACTEAGIDVPFGYKFLYWTPNDLERMKQAAEAFGRPVAIDCEIIPVGWSPQQVVDSIAAARQVLLDLGLYWGIYTGEWWWPGYTANNTGFAGDKLWHAAYPFNRPGQPPVLPPQNFLITDYAVNYGGWSRAELWQYANVCYGDDLGPWDFDMNSYEGGVAPPLPPVPTPPARQWMYGSEVAGRERRGNQQVDWNNYVEIDKYGDEAGLYPGQHWHNEAGVWRQILP